jgi:SAM-dependent methyltransferase
MSKRPRVPLLDVRSARAFHLGHRFGAVHRPERRLLEEPYLLPPRHRRFLVVGRDDAHAREVADRLRNAGWRGAEPAWGCRISGDSSLEPDNESELGGSPACGGADETGPSRGRLWEPAEFLAEVEPLLPCRGHAIDLACGAGRNAVYLALRGAVDRLPERAVRGVDVLPDALEQARRLRRASGCPSARVRFHCADLTAPRTVRSLLRPGRFSIAICFRYLDRALLRSIASALASGGMLVYETFLVKQREVHGKPANPAFLLEPGELRGAFPGLEVLRYREGEDATGSFTASLLARRP